MRGGGEKKTDEGMTEREGERHSGGSGHSRGEEGLGGPPGRHVAIRIR
jgi:hypothetical protein